MSRAGPSYPLSGQTLAVRGPSIMYGHGHMGARGVKRDAAGARWRSRSPGAARTLAGLMMMTAAGTATAKAADDVYIINKIAEGTDVLSWTEGGRVVFLSVDPEGVAHGPCASSGCYVICKRSGE